MKNASRLQFSTRAGTIARMLALVAVIAALGMNVVAIMRERAMLPSSPTESTPPERNKTHKTGPWVYVPTGVRV
jgi:hypothetical protein